MINFMDEDFELEDNAIIGGIAGFVEESMESDSIKDNIDEADSIVPSVDKEDITDTTLRLLYNQNPGLANHVIESFLRDKMGSEERRVNRIIMNEIDEEIDYLKKEEGEQNNVY